MSRNISDQYSSRYRESCRTHHNRCSRTGVSDHCDAAALVFSVNGAHVTFLSPLHVKNDTASLADSTPHWILALWRAHETIGRAFLIFNSIMKLVLQLQSSHIKRASTTLPARRSGPKLTYMSNCT